MPRANRRPTIDTPIPNNKKHASPGPPKPRTSIQKTVDNARKNVDSNKSKNEEEEESKNPMKKDITLFIPKGIVHK